MGKKALSCSSIKFWAVLLSWKHDFYMYTKRFLTSQATFIIMTMHYYYVAGMDIKQP